MAFLKTDVHSRRVGTWSWPIFALALCALPAAAQPPNGLAPGQGANGNGPGAQSAGQQDDSDNPQEPVSRRLNRQQGAGPGFPPGRGPGFPPGRGPGFQPGAGAAFPPAAQDQSAGMQQSASGGITLNFVNADVRDVAKAVLGDYLQLNYEISANTSGVVTIQTSKSLERAQVLPALEQALGLAGLALVHSNGIYEILPLADAHKQAGTNAPARTTN